MIIHEYIPIPRLVFFMGYIGYCHSFKYTCNMTFSSHTMSQLHKYLHCQINMNILHRQAIQTTLCGLGSLCRGSINLVPNASHGSCCINVSTCHLVSCSRHNGTSTHNQPLTRIRISSMPFYDFWVGNKVVLTPSHMDTANTCPRNHNFCFTLSTCTCTCTHDAHYHIPEHYRHTHISYVITCWWEEACKSYK